MLWPSQLTLTSLYGVNPHMASQKLKQHDYDKEKRMVWRGSSLLNRAPLSSALNVSTNCGITTIGWKQLWHRHNYFQQLWLCQPTFSHLETNFNYVSTPFFLPCHSHAAYVFVRPYEDLFHKNLSVLIGLVITSARFSLVCIFSISTLPSSTTSRTKWYWTLMCFVLEWKAGFLAICKAL